MKRKATRSMKWHPGIRIDKIPVRGWAGFLFVVATCWIFLEGVPEIRIFFLAAVVAGVLGAVILYFLRHK